MPQELYRGLLQAFSDARPPTEAFSGDTYIPKDPRVRNVGEVPHAFRRVALLAEKLKSELSGKDRAKALSYRAVDDLFRGLLYEHFKLDPDFSDIRVSANWQVYAVGRFAVPVAQAS